MKRLILLLVMLAVLSGGCAGEAPEPAPQPTETMLFESSAHTLQEPFLSAWKQAGGRSIGPPRSAPLWLDGRRVQLFGEVVMEAGEVSGVAVRRLPDGWYLHAPSDLLELAAAPQPATLGVVAQGANDGPRRVGPLTPLVVEVQIAAYSGAAELRLYDAQQRPAGRQSFELRDGSASLELLPRGALGPQWAIVLVGGQIAGAHSHLFTLEAETAVESGAADIDLLYPRIRAFMEQSVTAYTLDGAPVRGYRSPDNPLLWLRDHVYQGRGFRYFEPDVTSLLDAFRRAQRPDGSLPDFLAYPERSVRADRKQTESDLEFLFVQGVYEAWQMSGDDAWLHTNLAALRGALGYITSDPQRWDAEFGLVRRPYTIDTWDFEYGPTTTSPDGKPAPRHWIDAQTRWGIFHGDNTGLAYAMKLMARIEEQVGDPAEAQRWRVESRALMERLNQLSWGGSFYLHFVDAEGPGRGQPPQLAGVDTRAQLSLSNAYALNRELFGASQGRKIIEEYYRRRDFARAFAEWYSIDPPFPPGSYGMAGRKGEQPGEYVNGGVMPLVGGELARGAFRFSGEIYGFDILARYAELIRLTGETYLWYYPDGRPGISGPDTLASDGWGASAMLGALMEGAAGIEDRRSRFSEVVVSPRWSARPDLSRVRVAARYAASDGYTAYLWQRDERGLRLELTGSWQRAQVRLLLPLEAGEPQEVLVDGAATAFVYERNTRESRYAVVEVMGGDATIEVRW